MPEEKHNAAAYKLENFVETSSSTAAPPNRVPESKYIPSKELTTAREVAGFLNRPLLLAGEPGTGKTTYAHHVATVENRDLFIFNAKSVSQAQDLFYVYDAVAHFANKSKSAVEFISLEALGKSIINAFGIDKVKAMLLDNKSPNHQLKILRECENRDMIIERFLEGCCGNESVALIDEIDKAPRDFANDILNEIENYEFFIRELDLDISLDSAEAEKRSRMLVLITSNFDKNLPDAFLRRCLFHEIEFPDNHQLIRIIQSHIPDIDPSLLEKRIADFTRIRKDEGIAKPPSTSELIDCLKWLKQSKTLEMELHKNRAALATLLKKKNDFKLIYKDPPGAE